MEWACNAFESKWAAGVVCVRGSVKCDPAESTRGDLDGPHPHRVNSKPSNGGRGATQTNTERIESNNTRRAIDPPNPALCFVFVCPPACSYAQQHTYGPAYASLRPPGVDPRERTTVSEASPLNQPVLRCPPFRAFRCRWDRPLLRLLEITSRLRLRARSWGRLVDPQPPKAGRGLGGD